MICSADIFLLLSLSPALILFYFSQKCAEKQCRFSNKRLNKKFHRDQFTSQMENNANFANHEKSSCLPLVGESDVTKVEEDITSLESNFTTVQTELFIGEAGCSTVATDFTTGEADFTAVGVDITKGVADFITGGTDSSTSADVATVVADIVGDSETNIEEASAVRSTVRSKFKCSKCEKTFRKYGSARAHCKDKIAWKCPYCGEVMKHTSNKARHITRCQKKRDKNANNSNVGTNPKPVQASTKCSVCNKTYNSLASLRAHISYKHWGDRDGDFQCVKCEFVTKLKSELKKHFTLKHEKVKFECPKCDYSCSSSSGIKKHRLAAHREADSSFFRNLVGVYEYEHNQTPEGSSATAATSSLTPDKNSDKALESDQTLVPPSCSDSGASQTPENITLTVYGPSQTTYLSSIGSSTHQAADDVTDVKMNNIKEAVVIPCIRRSLTFSDF